MAGARGAVASARAETAHRHHCGVPAGSDAGGGGAGAGVAACAGGEVLLAADGLASK